MKDKFLQKLRSDLAKGYVLKRRVRDDLKKTPDITFAGYVGAMFECEAVIDLLKKKLDRYVALRS